MNMKRKQQTTLSNFFNPKKTAAALDETPVVTRLEDEEDLEEGTTAEPDASSVPGKWKSYIVYKLTLADFFSFRFVIT